MDSENENEEEQVVIRTSVSLDAETLLFLDGISTNRSKAIRMLVQQARQNKSIGEIEIIISDLNQRLLEVEKEAMKS